MNAFGFFECQYCDKRYLKEAPFKKHRCRTMDRMDHHATPLGKTAYRAYSHWFKVRSLRVPELEYFLESKQYTAFANLAEFAGKVMLPDIKGYVKFCATELEMLPNFWCRGDVYEQYILAFDDLYPPMEQARMTIKTLDAYARSLDCEPSEMLQYLYVNDIVKLIQCKKLSLWVLLNWDSFIQYLDKVDRDEWPVLQAVVNLDNWVQKFNKQPKTAEKVKRLVKEFGI